MRGEWRQIIGLLQVIASSECELCESDVPTWSEHMQLYMHYVPSSIVQNVKCTASHIWSGRDIARALGRDSDGFK